MTSRRVCFNIRYSCLEQSQQRCHDRGCCLSESSNLQLETPAPIEQDQARAGGEAVYHSLFVFFLLIMNSSIQSFQDACIRNATYYLQALTFVSSSTASDLTAVAEREPAYSTRVWVSSPQSGISVLRFSQTSLAT